MLRRIPMKRQGTSRDEVRGGRNSGRTVVSEDHGQVAQCLEAPHSGLGNRECQAKRRQLAIAVDSDMRWLITNKGMVRCKLKVARLSSTPGLSRSIGETFQGSSERWKMLHAAHRARSASNKDKEDLGSAEALKPV